VTSPVDRGSTSRPALGIAAAGYGHVELHDLDPDPPTAPGGEVAGAELVLAHPSVKPLREIGIEPDPLTGFARDREQVDADDRLLILWAQRRERQRLTTETWLDRLPPGPLLARPISGTGR
jgi:hypothetical protein